MSGKTFDPQDTTNALARVRAWEALGQAAIIWVDLRDQALEGKLISPASLRESEQELAKATQELRRHVPAARKPVVQQVGPLCVICMARPAQGTLRWPPAPAQVHGSVPCCAPCRDERNQRPITDHGLVVAQARQAKGLVTHLPVNHVSGKKLNGIHK